MVNNSTVINIDNTNVRGNNNISIDKEHNRFKKNNNTNSHTGENQNLERNKYRSKIIRHLRKIESRIKKDPNPKHQTTDGRTRTQHQIFRKQSAQKKHDHPKFKKGLKFIFLMYLNTVVFRYFKNKSLLDDPTYDSNRPSSS